jgi:hypothetical protein
MPERWCGQINLSRKMPLSEETSSWPIAAELMSVTAEDLNLGKIRRAQLINYQIFNGYRSDLFLPVPFIALVAYSSPSFLTISPSLSRPQ